MTSARARWASLCLGTLAAFGVAELLLQLRNTSAMDLLVYRLGGAAVLDGEPLYSVVSPIGGYQFTYPPVAGILLTPVAVLPWEATKVLWHALLALALACLWRLCVSSAPRLRALPAALFAAVVVASGALEPIWQNFHLGQISLLLVVLAVLDLAGPIPPRWRGLLTGVTAAVKLTPLIFLPWLVVTRQWRAAGNLVAAFLGAGLVGAVVLPADSRVYWTELFFDSGRIGAVEFANNQSVMGTLVRFGMTPGGRETTLGWLVVGGLLALLALAAAVSVQRPGDRLLAVGVVGLLGCLLSPVSWTHHWAWVLPVGVGLASRWGWRAALVWWVPFVVAPHLRVPRKGGVELEWTAWQQLAGETYVWWTVLLLAWIVWRAAAVDRTRSVQMPKVARG